LVVLAAVLGFATFAATAMLEAGLTIGWATAGQRMIYGLATDLFLRLQRLSLIFHSKRTVGDSLARITGTHGACM
jgi:ATP-binding cassette subfamily B protein/subfamily B ATP-binding cassette protein MsbA